MVGGVAPWDKQRGQELWQTIGGGIEETSGSEQRVLGFTGAKTPGGIHEPGVHRVVIRNQPKYVKCLAR